MPIISNYTPTRLIAPSIPMLLVLATIGAVTFVPDPAKAVTCASGLYRHGCAGPNGAVVVNKQPPIIYRHPPATVSCASGVYRAGCVGPNGAVVARKPY